MNTSLKMYSVQYEFMNNIKTNLIVAKDVEHLKKILSYIYGENNTQIIFIEEK